METQNQSRREAELYQEIYKNVTMGAQSLTDLIGRSRGDLKTELGVELAGYEKLAEEAREALFDMGVTPREQGVIAKLSAKAGMAMSTMMDTTTSHLAQMTIEGSTMGTTDLLRKINEYECEAGEKGEGAEKVLNLARRTVDFEESCIEKLKTYL